jgi:hypothetical protein
MLFGQHFFRVDNLWWSANFWVNKFWGLKHFWGQQFLGIKIGCGKHFRSKQNLQKEPENKFLPPFKKFTQTQPLLAVT